MIIGSLDHWFFPQFFHAKIGQSGWSGIKVPCLPAIWQDSRRCRSKGSGWDGTGSISCGSWGKSPWSHPEITLKSPLNLKKLLKYMPQKPSPKWSLLFGIRRFIVVSKRLVTEIAYDRVYHIRDDNQKSIFEQPFQSLPDKLRPYLTAPKNLIIGGWRWLLSVGGPTKTIVCSRKEPHWSNHPCCIGYPLVI